MLLLTNRSPRFQDNWNAVRCISKWYLNEWDLEFHNFIRLSVQQTRTFDRNFNVSNIGNIRPSVTLLFFIFDNQIRNKSPGLYSIRIDSMLDRPINALDSTFDTLIRFIACQWQNVCVWVCVSFGSFSYSTVNERERRIFVCGFKNTFSRVSTHAGLGTRRFPTECREKSHSNLALVITGLTWFTQRTRMIQSFTLSPV